MSCGRVRLWRYAVPHQRSLVSAAAGAMAVYAAASGGLAYQFKPIIDEVLPESERVWRRCSSPSSRFSVLKGLGGVLLGLS